MHIGYLQNRQTLGFKTQKDIEAGNKIAMVFETLMLKKAKQTFLLIFSNSKRKSKRVFLYATFIFQLGQPLVPYAAAVMVPLPPQISIEHVVRAEVLRGNTQSPGIAPIIKAKMDKMTLTDYQVQELEAIFIKLQDNSITMDQAVLEIRGGGFEDLSAILMFVIFVNWYDSFFGVKAFQANPLPHQDPFSWLSGKYDSRNVGPSPSRPPTSLEMEKPAAMPQQQYSGMTKAERRQLPDPKGRDGVIKVEGYPQLDLRFNQVEYKTPKHGPDHGLPKESNGKTPKTEAIALRDSLLDMPSRQNIVWYTDGQYQGGTPRGCDCVNLFDPDTNLIAVYKKQPDGSNLFLTTCRLTPLELKHLKDTNGNFLPEKMIKQQSAVSTNIQDLTNTNNDLQ